MDKKTENEEITDYTDFTHIDTPAETRKKLDVGDIFLNQGVAQCCGWVIRSKNRHHMAKCQCGKAFIDGGSWYSRIGGNVEMHAVLYTDRHGKIETKTNRAEASKT